MSQITIKTMQGYTNRKKVIFMPVTELRRQQVEKSGKILLDN